MARDAKINDGLFEFFIIKNISRFLLIILFIQLALKIPLSPKLVSLYKLEKVEINSERLESINVDGEILGQSIFKAKILTQSYNLFS
jgi:diacylglycerol kinase family enzyme